MQKTSKKLEAWLSKVDKTGLPGRFKAWIYQHSILPRILWLLLVYAVPTTPVGALKISYLRRWLGLPRSLSSAALYGTSNIHASPSSLYHRHRKLSSTKNPGIQKWHQLASRFAQARNGAQTNLWRWLSHG
ncbi:hypothetical protein N1851_019559 [Merluccius polli]|uniref:Uncharacterized protein n=1 Tax=Merluccius polli TaxID=89951 RepID=A0AA47MLY8_MERPO|nr:hypothetical protein N1851_019559 [Merluccius polli]